MKRPVLCDDRATPGSPDLDRAFARLARRHDESLRGLAYAIVGDEERLDPVLHDAYVAAYEDRDALRDGIPPAQWLARAVYDSARRDARQHGRSPRITADETIAALSALPVDEIAATVLVDGEGLDAESTARIIGIEPQGVGPRLARARASLQSALPGRRPVSIVLQELRVPPHRPEFWNRLGAHLLSLREVDPQTAQAETDHEDEPPARSDLDQLRASQWQQLQVRPVRPQSPAAPIHQLAARQRAARRPERPRITPHVSALPVLAALTVVTLVALLLALVARGGGGGNSSAIDIADKVDAAWADAETVQGSVLTTRYDTGSPVSTAAAFAMRADGSYRFRPADGSFDVAYDAASGTRRQLRSDGVQTTGVEETGLPPGPPDSAAVPALPFLPELQSALSVLRTAEDPAVRSDTIDERPVWVVDAGTPSDLVTVVVDRHTAFVTQVTRHNGEATTSDLAFSELTVDQPLADDALSLTFPDDVQVRSFAYGFTRLISVEEVDSAVGYVAPTPAYLPSGFELAEVAVAPAAINGSAGSAARTGADGSNPSSEGVVVLLYRRGFDLVMVTTRRAGDVPAAWTDPFGPAPAGSTASDGTVAGGVFDGMKVAVVDPPGTLARLWGVDVDTGLVVTVAGDVPVDELMRVAESLGQ